MIIYSKEQIKWSYAERGEQTFRIGYHLLQIKQKIHLARERCRPIMYYIVEICIYSFTSFTFMPSLQITEKNIKINSIWFHLNIWREGSIFTPTLTCATLSLEPFFPSTFIIFLFLTVQSHLQDSVPVFHYTVCNWLYW